YQSESNSLFLGPSNPIPFHKNQKAIITHYTTTTTRNSTRPPTPLVVSFNAKNPETTQIQCETQKRQQSGRLEKRKRDKRHSDICGIDLGEAALRVSKQP
ncbi:hypothetical protein AABB24_036496, partial [Solanum stoloniferum]